MRRFVSMLLACASAALTLLFDPIARPGADRRPLLSPDRLHGARTLPAILERPRRPGPAGLPGVIWIERIDPLRNGTELLLHFIFPASLSRISGGCYEFGSEDH